MQQYPQNPQALSFLNPKSVLVGPLLEVIIANKLNDCQRDEGMFNVNIDCCPHSW
jgi:hypothetical protein